MRKSLLRSTLKTHAILTAVAVQRRDELAKRLERNPPKRGLSSRDLTGRPNGTIDPFYGCDLLGEAALYALNFSIPWST